MERRTHPLAAIVPKPVERVFIVGQTGCGKTVLACDMLEQYHRQHPRHRIFILDPKRAFFDAPDQNSTALFPYGTLDQVRGKRRGIFVNARLLDDPGRSWFAGHETAFIVQEGAMAWILSWIYDHPDDARPSLVFGDELLQFMRGIRADPLLRAILQQGRGLSVGFWGIHQTPRFIDHTLLSETDRLYIGTLYDPRDKERLMSVAPLDGNRRLELLKTLPHREFWMLNRLRPQNSFRFVLEKRI